MSDRVSLLLGSGIGCTNQLLYFRLGRSVRTTNPKDSVKLKARPPRTTRRFTGNKTTTTLIAVAAVASVLACSAAATAESGSAPDTYVEPTSSYHAVPYTRVLDATTSNPLGPDESRNVQVTGTHGVPSTGVAAVALDVTVVDTTYNGWGAVKIWITGIRSRTTQWSRRPTAMDRTLIPSSPNRTHGMITVNNSGGQTQLNIDNQRYLSEGSGGYHSMQQTVVNTPQYLGISGRLGNSASRDVQVTGEEVPTGTTAVLANVAQLTPTGNGGLWLYPRDGARPYYKQTGTAAGRTTTTAIVIP